MMGFLTIGQTRSFVIPLSVSRYIHIYVYTLLAMIRVARM